MKAKAIAAVMLGLQAACAQPQPEPPKPAKAAGGHADIPGLPHAGALAKRVKPGQTVALLALHQINPDCTPRAYYDVEVAQPPQHGALAITHRNEYPNLPQSSSRAACNKMKLPAAVADYTAAADYAGDDFIVLDIITDNGSYRRVEIPVTVGPPAPASPPAE